MVAFQIDTALPFDERVIRAGNAAMGLWVRAGTWSAAYGQALIPAAVADALSERRPQLVRALVESGLWAETVDGYRFASALGMVETVRPSRPGIPHALRQAVLNRDGRRCRACGKGDDLQLDHVRPFSIGGPTTFENLQVLCGPCNRAKGARS